MKIRKATSLTVLLTFVLLVLTSVILYIVPHGRVAYWADWHLWGLTKTQWGNIHINLGLLLLLGISLHIYYNWKVIVSYFKDKARRLKIFTKEFSIALALTIVFIMGTCLEIPPFIWVIEISESVKDKNFKQILRQIVEDERQHHLILQKLFEMIRKEGKDWNRYLSEGRTGTGRTAGKRTGWRGRGRQGGERLRGCRLQDSR